MFPLLSAEFVRMYKSTVFRLAFLFSAGVGVFIVLMRFFDVRKNADIYSQASIAYRNLDGVLFNGPMYFIFSFAVFIGLFVGTEYSDGTIRNKLMIGHKRSSIFLSKFIICALAETVMLMIYYATMLLLGSWLIEGTTMKASTILLYIFCSEITTLALTALLLLFSMSIQSRGVGAVVCLLTVICMLFASLTIENMLNAPEYIDAYSYEDEETGDVISVERKKNPHYLSGTKRKVYETLSDTLPVSQFYQLQLFSGDGQKHGSDVGRMAAYDVVILLVLLGGGMVIFQRKDLK